MRKGFTLIELLIGALIGAIVILASIVLFSYGYRLILKTISNSRSNTSIFQVVEIINYDLSKAGYGIENQPDNCSTGNQTDNCPVNWIPENKTLVIKYVDYEKDLNGDDIPDCENEIFGDGNFSECDYEITYQLKNNNLYRIVDKEADGNTPPPMPMFDGNLIKVEDFSVNSTTHSVEYTINGTIEIQGKEENFTIGDRVICRNWK